MGAVTVPRSDFLAVVRRVRDLDVRLTTDRMPVDRLTRPSPRAALD
jgi:leucyl/phenylalanyl-tRNA--protein transferase